jgi:hypothetical protein
MEVCFKLSRIIWGTDVAPRSWQGYATGTRAPAEWIENDKYPYRHSAVVELHASAVLDELLCHEFLQ